MRQANNLLKYSFFFFVILLFYKSMYLYILWNVHEGYLSLITAALGLLYIVNLKEKLYIKKRFVFACVIFFISSYHSIIEGNFNYTFFFFLKTLCIYLILILPIERKKELLKLVTISFSFILGISFVFYALVLIGIPLPNYGTLHFSDGSYSFTNYGLFLKNMRAFGFFRFNSVFLEPGHVAVIASYILYANEYRLKNNKYLVVILITTLASFSLAGYVLLAAGYVLSLSKKREISLKVRYLGSLFVVLLFSIGFAKNYNNGENYLNELIVERLQFDEERGITGWNRTSDVVDVYYDFVVESGIIWVGLGNKEFQDLQHSEKQFEAAGYKPYLMTYGILGAFLVFVFYTIIASAGPAKRKQYLMLILYIISFVQRAYPEWLAWIIPFICSNWTMDPIIKRKNR